jgi:gas vesicle protein
MGTAIAFFAGLFIGGIIGMIATALCAASGMHREEDEVGINEMARDVKNK